MNRRAFISAGVVTAACAVVLRGSNHEGATLQVHASYTGSGKVDDSHRFYVALWDTPDFIKEGANTLKPIGTARIMSKSGTATFENVAKTSVYLSMAYDATGKWTDPQSDPPAGTSLGLYSKEPGVPEPIELEPGKTTPVSAELDDSYQKP